MGERWTISLDLAATLLSALAIVLTLSLSPGPGSPLTQLESTKSTSPPQLSTGTESLLHDIYTTQLITVQPDGSV